ncbi:sterol-sensing domain of SREBP cleavage-activation-domain-containing protein [Xylaria sp. CBS 124048]|nr:sterol-sensing domain of SREBP cleavage-activation-domain-containing protein [Xylaria sp. CBS 124048]
MIWYLLYPFRGTTEPPVLDTDHPLYCAFSRYGRYAAGHVMSTLLIFVAVAASLVYPFPFLYTNEFTNAASSLPHHVWTDAHLLDEKTNGEPDVIMRSLWVHGNYFQALNKEVLLGALELQNELLGPTVNFNPRQQLPSLDMPFRRTGYLTLQQRDSLHVANGLTNESWFFQSPLQYWSCSSELIERDDHILATVNEMSNQPTSVNVTLRPSIVFSGKRFEDRRLVAADALVITLIHRRDSPVGRLWQERVQALASTMSHKWRVITPPNNNTSQLYQFQFRLMSKVDIAALGAAYSLALVYFLFNLSKLRAVKSKIGLMITVVAQIALAIISSFTVCAIFQIDLSKIPRFVYPLVLFFMSVENMLRLINAVILTPPEDSTSNRIGHAFGQTAPIALASVAQNLLVLYCLSRVVSSGVSAFCTFGAIAIIFDLFYLSTFFLTVLSVDVRRTELSDALTKASIVSHGHSHAGPPHREWPVTVHRGRVTMSAGTIVMIVLVLIAQWHFVDNDGMTRAFRKLTHIARKHHHPNRSMSSSLVEVHQARSPTSWLMLQDHETAREVINVINPTAYSYTARVLEPYIFVLKGSDRMLSAHERVFSPAIYDFARHQLVRFFATILIIIAAVRLLMNYLLWDVLSELGAELGPNSLLTIKTLPGHSLDVVLLSASSAGHLVSVGLDKVVRVWNIRKGGYNYPLSAPFPILATCIGECHWLALLTVNQVLLWDLVNLQWGPSIEIKHCRQKPELFFFGRDDHAVIPPLILVRRGGDIIELRPASGKTSSYKIPDERVVSSVDALTEKAFPPKIMTSTPEGQVYLVTQEGSDWVSIPINAGPHSFAKEREFVSIQALPDLNFFLIIRSQTVDLVDSQTHKTIYTFRVDPILPQSLKAFHSRPRRMRCGSVALWSFTIAYLNTYTGDLVVQTYSPKNEDESLCFCDPESPSRATCCPWKRAKETRRTIKNPGVWLALPSGIMVGVRRKTPEKTLLNSQVYVPSSSQSGGLRRRRYARTLRHPVAPSQQAHDDWEAWVFSHYGGKLDMWETAPLRTNSEDEGHLFTPDLGPMTIVGNSSIAVGLSNVIKIITVGHERFETEDMTGSESGVPTVNARRRRGARPVRSRPTGPLSPGPTTECCEPLNSNST